MSRQISPKTQWHPPFCRSIRIEFAREEDYLKYEEEYPIRKLPGRIDLMIRKDDDNYTVKKSLGRIFKRYNLFEYKPQGDYVSVNDYYYMMGNAALLCSTSSSQNRIETKNITITFVSYSRPRKLMKYLKSKYGEDVVSVDDGIYYLQSAVFPTQFVVIQELNPQEYLWLGSLHKGLDLPQQERLVQEYRTNRENQIYEEVMSFIASINIEEFRRYEDMCKGLMEVVRPEIELEKQEAIKQAEPDIIKKAEENMLLRMARTLKDCLDADTIAQKLGLPVEVVQKL